MDSDNLWRKVILNNGDECYILETEFNEEETQIKQIKNAGITIKGSNTPISAIDIVLVNNNNLVGYIGSSLYKDHTASLSMLAQIRNVELPKHLEQYREEIIKHDVAIYTSDSYRGQGKGKQLINILFEYLIRKGVKDVKVSSISNEIAENFYQNTGAELLGDRNAIYKDIEKLIKKGQRNIEYEER